MEKKVIKIVKISGKIGKICNKISNLVEKGVASGKNFKVMYPTFGISIFR